MFVLPDADFADDADERRSFIVLKENKSAFLCVICARLRPVNTSKRTDKSAFISFRECIQPTNHLRRIHPFVKLFGR